MRRPEEESRCAAPIFRTYLDNKIIAFLSSRQMLLVCRRRVFLQKSWRSNAFISPCSKGLPLIGGAGASDGGVTCPRATGFGGCDWVSGCRKQGRGGIFYIFAITRFVRASRKVPKNSNKPHSHLPLLWIFSASDQPSTLHHKFQ